jgi:hypothetical protein
LATFSSVVGGGQFLPSHGGGLAQAVRLAISARVAKVIVTGLAPPLEMAATAGRAVVVLHRPSRAPPKAVKGFALGRGAAGNRGERP